MVMWMYNKVQIQIFFLIKSNIYKIKRDYNGLRGHKLKLGQSKKQPERVYKYIKKTKVKTQTRPNSML